ncbi:MAG: hypothetical protein JW873_04330 [Candidatus Saganbacteria bacterium]|nr:hypothetical protein [Candidatus Saganbacteria bacterium]
MKKFVFASLLLLLCAFASLAEGSNYQIYSEGKGFLGLGGRKVIMLDKSTGDTWLYTSDKWVPIVREASAEAKASADELARAQLAAELAALKDKQAQDISALQTKHEEELGALRAKLEADKQSASAARPARRAAVKARPLTAGKKAAAAEKEESASGDEAPPAWLTD